MYRPVNLTYLKDGDVLRILDRDTGKWVVAFGPAFPSFTQGFPPPPVGANFWRTDLGAWYKWTGSAWTALGTSGTITVEEVDGVPSIANVTTLQVDSADGLVLTDVGGGVVRIDLTTGIDTLSNAISALETRVSTLETTPAGVSVTSVEVDAVRSVLSIADTQLSNAVSALETRVSAMSGLLTTVTAKDSVGNSVKGLQSALNAISTAVENGDGILASLIIYNQNITSNARSIALIADEKASNALSALDVSVRLSTAGTSVRGLQSVINTLSNRISANSATGGVGSVTSTELSAAAATLSARVDSVWNVSVRLSTGGTSVRGLQSALNTLSSRISANSGLGGGGSVTSSKYSVRNAAGTSVKGFQSALDALSNKTSVVSQAVSALEVRVSAVSAAASNALSVGNAASAAAANALSVGNDARSIGNAASAAAAALSTTLAGLSVKSAATSVKGLQSILNTLSNHDSVISNTVSALEVRVSAASTAASNALSVATDARSIGNAASAAAAALSTTLAGLSAKSVGGTSVKGLQSIINALSNKESVISNALSALEVRVSTMSNVASNALSVANAASGAAAALSTTLAGLSVKSVGGTSVKGLQSILNALSNRISAGGGVASVTSTELSAAEAALSNKISALEVRVSALSTAPAGVSVTSTELSAAVAALSTRVDSVWAVSAKSGATSVRGIQSALNAIQNRVSANSGTGGGGSVTSTELSAAVAILTTVSARSITSTASVKGLQSAINALSATIWDAMSVGSTAAVNLSARINSVQSVHLDGLGTGVQLRQVTGAQVVSATSFTKVSGMSVSLAANVPYQIQGRVLWTTSILTGTAFGFVYPGANQMTASHVVMRCITSIVAAGAINLASANNAVGAIQAANMSTVATAQISTAGGASAATYMLEIEGVLKTLSAGVVELQVKQSATGGGVQILPGSFIRAFKLT